jgi:SEC-C motif/Protein of unknown function (DUF1186)
MTEPEFPLLTLKTDDKVGVYFLCDEAGADDLRDFLTGDEVPFSFNPSEGANLAEAGKVLFAFGKAHPGFVATALEFISEEVLIDPAVVMPEDAYQPPVKQLLWLGEAQHGKKRNYVALGLSRHDVPALIRMATDEQLHEGPAGSPVIYAPVHAWNALLELHAVEAIEPLVKLFRRLDEAIDDWVSEDLPQDLAEFGAAALEPLRAYLADPTHGDWSRVAAAKGIGLIAEKHPDLRADCLARLSAQLDRFADQSETLNAFLISSLWDLRAVEAMPAIQRAFASGRVDESVTGDVEDVQIEFGLKSTREHPRKPNALKRLGERFGAQWRPAGLPPPDANRNFPETADDFPKLDAEPRAVALPYIAPPKVGRNQPCPCGSGKKYKKCCGG